MNDETQILSVPFNFSVTISAEELIASIAEHLTNDQIVELIVRMDEDYISDWDFSKALFKRYEEIMKKYEEEENDT